MDSYSPYSELSESFLTPPKPYSMNSKNTTMQNRKQEEIFSSSLCNNTSNYKRDLEIPSSPKNLKTFSHLKRSDEEAIYLPSLVGHSMDASKILCSRTTPGRGSAQMEDKDILIIQSAIKDLRNSIAYQNNTSAQDKENTDKSNVKRIDKFK